MKLIVEEEFERVEGVIEESINEATGRAEKKYVIKGTFSTPNEKNRNGRIYAEALWRDNVTKYQKNLQEGNINTLCELEHPPRTSVNQWEAVAKIRKLEMRGGRVYGEAVILNDGSRETNKIKGLIDAGIKIGVSSRGVGKMKGDIVEAFNLITYDIVSTPSDYNANLEGFNESLILEGVEIEEDGKGGYICTPEGCTLKTDKEVKSLDEGQMDDYKELKGKFETLKTLLKDLPLILKKSDPKTSKYVAKVLGEAYDLVQESIMNTYKDPDFVKEGWDDYNESDLEDMPIEHGSEKDDDIEHDEDCECELCLAKREERTSVKPSVVIEDDTKDDSKCECVAKAKALAEALEAYAKEVEEEPVYTELELKAMNLLKNSYSSKKIDDEEQ